MKAALQIVNRLLENDEADEFIQRELVDKPLPSRVRLIGHRFFNKRKGSTTHTCEIWVDGKLIGKTGPAYGYGDQYEESGLAWLEDQMIVPRRPSKVDGMMPWHWFEQHGINYNRVAHDVKKASDL